MGSVVAQEERVERRVKDRSLAGMKLFSGNANPALAKSVADYLGVALGKLTSTRFADGEIRIMVEESARGAEIFLIQPTCCPTNENLMELFIMLDAFRRASARRITVVMPYYGYARQDKKIKPREPITARMIADFIENRGADRVVAIDLHAEQIQGFFNIPVDHLYGGPIIGHHLIERGFADAKDIVIVSPDVGGATRANALAEMMGTTFVVIAKKRPEPNQVEVVEVVGNCKNKRCILIDDLIDTGNSIVSGAEALLERGAKEVIACCSHAVFSRNAGEKLQNSCLSEVICLDTIPLADDQRFEKLKVLSAAPLLGEAIRRIHHNESVSELFHGWR